MKKALVTGITGQDGSYLAELLLGKGYEVYGIIRRSSSFHTGRIDHLYKDPHEQPKLKLIYGDLTDGSDLSTVVNDIQPDEVYNLGAQSHVRVSFDMPIYTANVDALGTLRLLEAKKRRPFTQGVLMGVRRFTAIGRRLITGKRMACLRAMGFYLTMNRHVEVRRSLPER